MHEVKAWLSVRGKGHFSTEGCILKARFHGCVQLRVTFEHVVACPAFLFIIISMLSHKIRCCFQGTEAHVCQRSSSFPGLQKPSSCCDKNQLCQSRREGSAAGFAQEKTGFLKSAHKWDTQVHVNTLTNTHTHTHMHARQQSIPVLFGLLLPLV